MIVFLTLCYVGLLAALLKLGVVKPTLFWKLSPLLWMVLLFVVLFIPMQWGAPAGKVQVYQPIIEIIPNVSGEVVEVPVVPLDSLKTGDVLFRIDPVPFQNEVDRLTADLADAEQDVLQLAAAADAADAVVDSTEQEIDVRKSELQVAAEQVKAVEALVKEAEAQEQASVAEVTDRAEQLSIAARRVERLKVLVPQEAASKDSLDNAEAQYVGLEAQLNNAEAQRTAASATVARRKADLATAQSNEVTARLKLEQTVTADLPRSQALAREARLAADARVGDLPTRVARIRAQLDTAKFNLEQTVVRAPSEGYVVALTLRPGQRVANFPVRSWMAFVPTEVPRVVAAIPQYAMRHIQKDHPAEVVLSLYPGRTLSAKVETIAAISSDAQIQPSGLLPNLPTGGQESLPYGVILRLEDTIDADALRGGALGSGAIYTEKAKMTHIIRRVMIRMETWMNFVFPS